MKLGQHENQFLHQLFLTLQSFTAYGKSVNHDTNVSTTKTLLNLGFLNVVISTHIYIYIYLYDEKTHFKDIHEEIQIQPGTIKTFASQSTEEKYLEEDN